MELQEIFFTESRMQLWCDDFLDGAATWKAPMKYKGIYAGHEFTAYYTERPGRAVIANATRVYPYRYTLLGRRYFRLQDIRDAIRKRNARVDKIIQSVETA